MRWVLGPLAGLFLGWPAVASGASALLQRTISTVACSGMGMLKEDEVTYALERFQRERAKRPHLGMSGRLHWSPPYKRSGG